jgi:hypothetical protein
MKTTLILLPLLCLSIASLAQTPQMEVFNPPTSGNGYSDLFNTILSVKKTTGANAVNGIAVFVYWNAVDNGCQSSSCQGQPPADVTGTGTCAEADCFWGTTAEPGIDQELLGYINGQSSNGLKSHNQKLNLILVPVPEGNGTSSDNGVPHYVFQPNTYSNWCSACSSLQPQDQATCQAWQGDSGAPTGGADGVWNVNECNLTQGGTCSGSTDQSGFPVLYEAPFAVAWSTFVNRVFKHYSSSGSFNGPAIAPYLGYIRVGLAEGGENQPYCTVDNKGIWPSPAGLSYDNSSGGTINADWYTTVKNYPACASPTDDTCQGKDAFLEGNVSQPGVPFQGYEQTIWATLQTDLANWDTVSHIMGNTHAGPPGLNDTNYADVEACILSGNPIGSPLCSVKDYSTTSGFGMEALSEWDVANGPDNCTDDWCYNFDQYHGYGLNLYLQTSYPNSEPGYTIVSISGTSSTTLEVTCASTPVCAYGGKGGNLQPLAAGEVVKISGNSGTSGTFTIATVIDGTHFTLDTSLCGVNGNVCGAGSNGTAYSADYLPDTIPFAIKNYVDTLEVYFCDWAYGFSANSSNDGCDTQESPYKTNYASILSNP